MTSRTEQPKQPDKSGRADDVRDVPSEAEILAGAGLRRSDQSSDDGDWVRVWVPRGFALVAQEPDFGDEASEDDPTAGMSEADLADYYDRTHDLSDFDEQNAVPVTGRRESTLSVRFSAAELEHIRSQAEQLGMKPTAYVRACALTDAARVGEFREIAEQLRNVQQDLDAQLAAFDKLTR